MVAVHLKAVLVVNTVRKLITVASKRKLQVIVHVLIKLHIWDFLVSNKAIVVARCTVLIRVIQHTRADVVQVVICRVINGKELVVLLTTSIREVILIRRSVVQVFTIRQEKVTSLPVQVRPVVRH